ncbi:hypothetical protein KCP77_14090 [Salmonella enterica subsp. enterica]|nr:hypothetical protein KCP77_14090 [Salmonella enterica subsp. enterica]
MLTGVAGTGDTLGGLAFSGAALVGARRSVVHPPAAGDGAAACHTSAR